MPVQTIDKIFRLLFSIGDRIKICHSTGFQSDFYIKNRPPGKKVALFGQAQFFKTGGKRKPKTFRYYVLMFINWNIQEIICGNYLYNCNFACL